jgi:hypothetical protein
VLVDAVACERATARTRAGVIGTVPPDDEARLGQARAIRHALAEYELPVHVVDPDAPLAVQLT